MSQATISIRVDENTKNQFDAFCADVGMNTSVAVNIFIKAVLREQRIPFEIVSGADLLCLEDNQRRKAFGCLKGKINLPNDFDEPLEDFAEYMQ